MNQLGDIPEDDKAPFAPALSYALNKATLKFHNPDVEKQFQEDNLKKALPIIRLSIFLGTILYGLFSFLDIFTLNESLKAVLLIRWTFVCPVLFTLFLLTYTDFFLRWSQWIMGGTMVSSGLGIVMMTAVADAPENGMYYAGLIMVVIYCSSLIGMRCVIGAAISAMLMLAYQASALILNPIPVNAVISNNFFLGMSVLVGIFSSYAHEYKTRENFIIHQQLTDEKTRARQLLKKAEEANASKTEFLAVMSHELRTPLNAIIGFSEIMKEEMFGKLGTEKYKSYAADIHSSGSHLLSIISDILDLSKAEVGKLALHEEDFDLYEVVNLCLRMFQESAASQGVRLYLNRFWEKISVRGDLRLIRQALINLTSNAIKFTPPGGEISISVLVTPDGNCILSVQDTGIGIAKENLERVVQPFVQVESAYSRKHPGSGLGLPLVRKIMEIHGGNFELQSQLSLGTTALVTLPASRISVTHNAAETGLRMPLISRSAS